MRFFFPSVKVLLKKICMVKSLIFIGTEAGAGEKNLESVKIGPLCNTGWNELKEYGTGIIENFFVSAKMEPEPGAGPVQRQFSYALLSLI